MERRRTIAWQKDDPFGVELAELTFGDDRLSAVGVAIGSDPAPYRLDYSLETQAGFATTRVVVTSRGAGWSRALELRRTGGGWSADATSEGAVDLPPAGGDTAGLATALDPDLGLSPLFNSLPALRHGVHLGGRAPDLLMVWISVPDLQIHPSPQRYTCIDGAAHTVRFESLESGSDFRAEIVFDRDGLVVDYPGIGRRLAG